LNLFLSNVSESSDVVKHGQSDEGKHQNVAIQHVIAAPLFATICYRGYLPEVKQQIADMAVRQCEVCLENHSGHLPWHSRYCTSGRHYRTLSLKTLKKDRHLKAVMKFVWLQPEPTQTIVALCQQDLRLKSMRCGVSSVQRNSNVGCGTRLTMARENIGVCVVQSSR